MPRERENDEQQMSSLLLKSFVSKHSLKEYAGAMFPNCKSVISDLFQLQKNVYHKS